MTGPGSLWPVGEIARRYYLPETHTGALGPAELGALVFVAPRQCGDEGGVIDLARNQILGYLRELEQEGRVSMSETCMA